MNYKKKYLKYKNKYMMARDKIMDDQKHGTYSDNDYIYSVDLMFMYINKVRPKYEAILVKKLEPQLHIECWGDMNEKFSPMDVIKNRTKYTEDDERIINADLSYPIIIYNNFIVDGMHRLTKAYLNGDKYINAYIFSDDLMNKFIISKRKNELWDDSDWNYYDNLTIEDIRKIYNDRFK